jgi:hypothetical protein
MRRAACAWLCCCRACGLCECRVQAWPVGWAVRELKTKLKSNVKDGLDKNTLVNVDLRKYAWFAVAWVQGSALGHVSARFMPIYCSERKKISQDTLLVSVASETLAEKKAERRLEPTAWVIAWEGYAIAAVILSQVFAFRARMCVPGRAVGRSCSCVFHSQLPYISAQQHKHHVQDIMLSAPSKPMMGAPKGVFMRPLLGVLYDEGCRCVECRAASLCHACACCSGVGNIGLTNPKSLGPLSQ